MKLIKPSVEYIPQEEGLTGVNKQIERCGRICYKSESKMTDTSAQGFVARMIKSGHLAMLEHGTIYIYLEVNPDNAFKKIDYPLANFTAPYNWSDVVGNISARYRGNPYSKVKSTNVEGVRKVYITTNYRVLIENDWLDDLMFAFNPTEHHERRYTMKFICDRGVSHELVRHRVFSFAQESQRYCNYSKDRFNRGITFIIPSWCDERSLPIIDEIPTIDTEKASAEFILWVNYLLRAEKAYLGLIGDGWLPQQARSVLPNATKTEIIMTGFEDDWKHFFDLRLRGVTGMPHPDMQLLAQLAWNEFKDKLNLEL